MRPICMFKMLRRALTFGFRSGSSIRTLSTDDGKKSSRPSPSEALSSDILEAVDAVAKDLHGNNSVAKKEAKSTLISKLMAHEKETFVEANVAQTSEMLEDKAVLNLLSDVASEHKKTSVPRPVILRQERRGMVLLRKEIFSRATQSGYSADEARVIAEKAVDEAQYRVLRQRKAQFEGAQESVKESEAEAAVRSEKEQKLFDYAFQTAEKMLYKDDMLRGGSRKCVVTPDPDIQPLLKSTKRLGVWDSLDKAEERGLAFWKQSDERAARIFNQSMGPENAFEEQIEWTLKEKQWPYPIDNEYKIGAEENVSFVEHIFLERRLPSLGLPKEGPIAHFMQLVCVGLSKNPYMPIGKKLEHLQWFANYFNAEKQKLVHRLHEEEQVAAHNA